MNITPRRNDLRRLNTLDKFSRELTEAYEGLSEETIRFLNVESREMLHNLNALQRDVDEALIEIKKPSEANYEHQKHRHQDDITPFKNLPYGRRKD